MGVLYNASSQASSWGGPRIESILNAYEMHLFTDEGYLILEYRDQGTILDLINIAKSRLGRRRGSHG